MRDETDALDWPDVVFFLSLTEPKDKAKINDKVNTVTLNKIITIILPFLFSAGWPMLAAAAEIETPRCSALSRSPSGQKADASYSAARYSEEHVGAVGISIFPGSDMKDLDPHAIGLRLVSALNQQDVEAACFVNHSKIRNGTSISYKINGVSWREGDSNLDIADAQDEETIRAVISEAKMVRNLLRTKRP